MIDSSRQPERILVVRTDRLGDVLLSTPVLSVLREQFPNCYLGLLVSPYTREVVEGHPALDAVFSDEMEKKHRGFKGLMLLAREIKSHRFDTVIVLHPTLRLALLGKLAGIPLRIGSGYRAYSLLFNRRVFEHRKDVVRHEVAYNLNLVSTLGVPSEKAMPKVLITEDEKEAIRARLNNQESRSGTPLIVLHPGSGGSARDWPGAYFAELADLLAAESMGRVVITGGLHETGLVRSITEEMKSTAVNLAGETTIKEMAALLAVSKLCVANSTGPMHLSAAVGTPTVALFCPITPCSPTRWGPYGEGHIVLKPEVPACPKCVEKACPYYDCMTRISVESVFQAVKEILQPVNEI